MLNHVPLGLRHAEASLGTRGFDHGQDQTDVTRARFLSCKFFALGSFVDPVLKCFFFLVWGSCFFVELRDSLGGRSTATRSGPRDACRRIVEARERSGFWIVNWSETALWW